MPTSHEILWVTKANRKNIHERILYIAGLNPNGMCWKLTPDEAIRGMENGEWKFYIEKENVKAEVFIYTSITGHQYLKTEADTAGANNLLDLPECPG